MKSQSSILIILIIIFFNLEGSSQRCASHFGVNDSQRRLSADEHCKSQCNNQSLVSQYGCSDSDRPDFCGSVVRYPIHLIKVVDDAHGSLWTDAEILDAFNIAHQEFLINLNIELFPINSIEVFNNNTVDTFLIGVHEGILMTREQSYSSDKRGAYIYFVDRIFEGKENVGGQSLFPCGFSTGSGNRTLIAKNISGGAGLGLIHELGHHFGLFHTFENFQGTSNYNSSDCDTGDLIGDTPGTEKDISDCHTYSLLCNTDDPCDFEQNQSTISCPNFPNFCSQLTESNGQALFENYMSYTNGSCAKRFSPSQIDKVKDILVNSCRNICCKPDPPSLSFVFDGQQRDIIDNEILYLNIDCTIPIICANLGENGSNTGDCVHWFVNGIKDTSDCYTIDIENLNCGDEMDFEVRDIPIYNSDCKSVPVKFKIIWVEPSDCIDCDYLYPTECQISSSIDLISPSTLVTCQNIPVTFEALDDCYSWYKYDRQTGTTSSSPLQTGSTFTPDVSVIGTCEFLLFNERNCHLQDCHLVLTLEVLEEGTIGTICEEECMGIECCTNPFTGSIFSLDEKCAGESINFQVSNPSDGYDYIWSSSSGVFGTGTSVTHNPTATSGSFVITLLAESTSDDCADVMLTKTISIKPDSECTTMTCGASPVINADFGASTTICEGSPICFTASLSGDDGSFALVQDQNGNQIGVITAASGAFDECFFSSISSSPVTYSIVPFTSDAEPCEGTPITQTYTILSSNDPICSGIPECNETPTIEVDQFGFSFCPSDFVEITGSYTGATVVGVSASSSGGTLTPNQTGNNFSYYFYPNGATTYTLTFTTIDASCDPVETQIVLDFTSSLCDCTFDYPIVLIDKSEVCLGDSFTFTEQGNSGPDVSWSANPSNGSFSSPNTTNTTFTPTSTGSYVVTLSIDDPDGGGDCAAESITFSVEVISCDEEESPECLIDEPHLVFDASSYSICGASGSTPVEVDYSGFGVSDVTFSGASGDIVCLDDKSNDGDIIIFEFKSCGFGASGCETITFTTNDPDGSGVCEPFSKSVEICVDDLGNPNCPCTSVPSISVSIIGDNPNLCEDQQINLFAEAGGEALSNVTYTNISGDGVFIGNGIIPGVLDIQNGFINYEVEVQIGTGADACTAKTIKSFQLLDADHPSCDGECPEEYDLILEGGTEVCLGECICFFGQMIGSDMTPN